MNPEQQAIKFLTNIQPGSRTLILFGGDADGMC